MEAFGSDRSFFEAVARRRNRCDRLVARAVSLGRTLYQAPEPRRGAERIPVARPSASLEAPMDPFSSLPSRVHEAEATAPVDFSQNSLLPEAGESVPSENDGKQAASTEASSRGPNAGIGSSLYEILDELIPQVDFSAIPATKPKRVMAKGAAMESGSAPSRGNASASESAKKGEAASKPVPRQKKKPASLLDSYFKGL